MKKLEKYYNEVSSNYEESDYFENRIVHRALTAVNVIKVMQVILEIGIVTKPKYVHSRNIVE